MKAILDAPNNEFLFTRIHAQWSRALTPARLLDIMASPGTGALETALKAAGISAPTESAIPRLVTLRFVRELAAIRSQLDPATGLFYSAFIDRLYLDNLMRLLQIRQAPARREELAALLLEAPELPPLHVEPLLQAASAAQMHALLPPSPFHRRLLPILREWDAGNDLFIAGCRFDSLAGETLMSAAAGLSEELAARAVYFAGFSLDIALILLLLRNLATYRLPPERLDSLGYASGRLIRPNTFTLLARQPGVEALVSLLPDPYAQVVRQAGPANPAAVEDALRTLHTRQVLDAFRSYNHPSLTLVAYPFLKCVERDNAIRVAEGLRLGLKPDALRGLIIGAPDV